MVWDREDIFIFYVNGFSQNQFLLLKREKGWVVHTEHSESYGPVGNKGVSTPCVCRKLYSVMVMSSLLLFIVATWLSSIYERTRIVLNTSRALFYLILITTCWGSNYCSSVWKGAAKVQSLAQGHVWVRLQLGPLHLPWPGACCQVLGGRPLKVG